jgi:hypothetical protein
MLGLGRTRMGDCLGTAWVRLNYIWAEIEYRTQDRFLADLVGDFSRASGVAQVKSTDWHMLRPVSGPSQFRSPGLVLWDWNQWYVCQLSLLMAYVESLIEMVVAQLVVYLQLMLCTWVDLIQLVILRQSNLSEFHWAVNSKVRPSVSRSTLKKRRHYVEVGCPGVNCESPLD